VAAAAGTDDHENFRKNKGRGANVPGGLRLSIRSAAKVLMIRGAGRDFLRRHADAVEITECSASASTLNKDALRTLAAVVSHPCAPGVVGNWENHGLNLRMVA
jgi:hypothetical protein